MLTVTRVLGESVVLLMDGKVIATIKVTRPYTMHHDRVRLSIDAPDNVRILRYELTTHDEKGDDE